MILKEKELLRNYRFRDYLKVGGLNRKSFSKLSLSDKLKIVKGFRL